MNQTCIRKVETEAAGQRRQLQKTVLEILLSILILASCIFSFLITFQVTCIKGILLIAFIFSPVLFRFLFHKLGEQTICAYLLFVAAGFGAAFYRQIWNGLLFIINQVFYILNDLHGFSHVPYEIPVEAGQEGIYTTLVLVLIIVLLSAGMTLGVRHRQTIVVFALSAPFLLFGICCMVKPNIPSLLTYVLSWILFIALCRISENKKRVVAISGNAGKLMAVISLAVVAAAAVGCGIAYLCLQASADQPLGMTGGVKEQIESFVGKMRYETNANIYKLPMGDLQNVGGASFTGDIALTVTMEKPRSVYLRGFVGGRYENNQWTSISRDKYSGDYTGIFEWLHLNGFYPQTQTGDLIANSAELGEIAIENIALNRKYIYTPYEALTGMDLAEGAVQYNQDTVILSGKIFGAHDYSFNMYLPQTDDYGSVDLMTWLNSLTLDSQIYEDYQGKEKVYRTFVYQAYLDIPEREDTVLREFLTEETVSRLDGRDYITIVQEIRQIFNENFIFSYDIDQIGEDEDFIEHFLETGEGYDVHFATLAVMILRQAGVPARYTEGYYIPPQDVEMYIDVDNIIFDLSDDYAHAWAEVYVDGIGWLPMEVTPGYYSLPEDEDSNDGTREDIEKTPYYNNIMEEEVSAPQEDAPEQNKVTAHNSWNIWIMVAILLIVIVLIYIIAGRYYKKRRIHAFCQVNATDAAISMYRHFTRLLKFDGVKIDNRAAYKVIGTAGDRYDIAPERTLRQFLDAVYRVRYSGKDQPLDQGEITSLLTYTTDISDLIYTRQKRREKLLMRLLWIRIDSSSFQNLKDS